MISILLQDGGRLLLESGFALLAETPQSVNLLLQDGGGFLLESGDHLLTEGEGGTPPTPPNIGALLLQSGFSFLLESGDHLLLETGATAPPDGPRAGFGPMLATPYLFGPRRPRPVPVDDDEEVIAILAMIAARR